MYMSGETENKTSGDDTVNKSELYLWAWDCGFDWDKPETLPPREQLTEDILHAALHDCPEAIAKIPRDLLTPAFCATAVYQDSRTLTFMPEECKTYDVYLTAVKSDGNLLEQIPEEHKTRELCRAALVSTKCDIRLFDLFPQTMSRQDRELLYFDVTRERIEKLEYKAARSLAIRQLHKETPKYNSGITEEAIEAKITELNAALSKHYREHKTEEDANFQKFLDAVERGEDAKAALFAYLK
jgi:hypothetical protein